MPSQNIVKIYVKYCYYHIYNRGVNRTSIFVNEKDRTKFVYYLDRAAAKNHINIIKIVLDRNHFHLLIHQKDIERGIEKLMRSLATSYSMYFNFKHNRVGHLFQSPYKARLLEDSKGITNVMNYLDHHKEGDVFDTDITL